MAELVAVGMLERCGMLACTLRRAVSHHIHITYITLHKLVAAFSPAVADLSAHTYTSSGPTACFTFTGEFKKWRKAKGLNYGFEYRQDGVIINPDQK